MMRTCDQSSRLKAFVLYHLPAMLVGCGIVALSSIPNLSAPGLGFAIPDKLAHFLEYAIFAALAFRSLTHLVHQYDYRQALLRGAIYVTFFAAVDELVLQRFIPGRSSDMFDLLSDLGGAYLVLVLALVFFGPRSEAI